MFVANYSPRTAAPISRMPMIGRAETPGCNMGDADGAHIHETRVNAEQETHVYGVSASGKQEPIYRSASTGSVRISSSRQARVPRWVDDLRVADPATRYARSQPSPNRDVVREGGAEWVLVRWLLSPTPELGSHGRILGKSSPMGEIVSKGEGLRLRENSSASQMEKC
jgi:hypothetical protein